VSRESSPFDFPNLSLVIDSNKLLPPQPAVFLSIDEQHNIILLYIVTVIVPVVVLCVIYPLRRVQMPFVCGFLDVYILLIVRFGVKALRLPGAKRKPLLKTYLFSGVPLPGKCRTPASAQRWLPIERRSGIGRASVLFVYYTKASTANTYTRTRNAAATGPAELCIIVFPSSRGRSTFQLYNRPPHK